MQDVNSIDRPATYNWNMQAQEASDILRVGVIILPAFFLTNHHTRGDFGSLLVMGLEVSAILSVWKHRILFQIPILIITLPVLGFFATSFQKNGRFSAENNGCRIQVND